MGLTEAEIIDIDLYSPTIGNISNFSNVEFNVEVPIDNENLKVKDLFAYYIDDNGNIEEHAVTVDDFMANFEIDHFSTYIISGKIKSNILNSGVNPKTGDSIIMWILSGCVSVIGLLLLRKKVG